LANLGLLFVPAGVGVVLYLPVLAKDWAPLSLAILVGTLAAIGVTGLLAQGMSSWSAAVVGVHLHGLAGDIAAAKHGMDAMTSGDLADHLANAWQDLRA